MPKPNISKIISKIKEDKKMQSPDAKKPGPIIIKGDSYFDIHRIKERDMRREAMDMGSHGASEYFGEAK